MFTRLVTCLIASLGFTFAATAAEIKVLAPNAAKESVTEAISIFEKTTGHKVSISWSGTEAITKRVADGEAVDVVVNAAQIIDRQSKDGKLAAATRTDFAKSGIGVAVPSSAAKLDVSTQDALKSALLSAKTVVVSSGTSGRHMVDVFSKLGIGEQVKAKTKQPPSGAQIADFLAAGDADIGFQQISELLHAKGINYLGPVPADLQNYTTYSAAISAGSANADVAKTLLEALRAPSTQAIVRASGMDPI
jgi:molybdate transport system substrate-binding protein